MSFLSSFCFDQDVNNKLIPINLMLRLIFTRPTGSISRPQKRASFIGYLTDLVTMMCQQNIGISLTRIFIFSWNQVIIEFISWFRRTSGSDRIYKLE